MKGLQSIKTTENGILIVSTVRNCSRSILRTIDAVDNYLESKHKEFLFIESDSDDNTVAILKELSAARSNFKYLSMGNLKTSIPRRTERIAFCRNKYLTYMHENCKHFEYLVVIDSDGIISEIDDSNISSFPNINWHALAGNVRGYYYDVWALRADSWCNHDCWRRYQDLIQMGMTEYQSYRNSVWGPTIRLNPHRLELKVDSAFGGLAIYKVRSIPKTAKYIGVDVEGNEICEHVSFNLAIKNYNQKSEMYILPGLIVGESPPEHTKYAGLAGLANFRLRKIIKSNLQKLSDLKDKKIFS